MADPTRRFEALYTSHSADLLAYAARRTSSGADAADVVADTFLVAWRRIEEVPAGDDARPWLFGVARGVLANHRRGLRRRSTLSERVAGEVDRLVADATHGREPSVSAEVVAALDALGDDDRELLLLVGWDGLSPQQAAVVVGCSAGAARVRLHRARRRFDAQLRRLGIQRAGIQQRAGSGVPDEPQRRAAAARVDLKEA